MSMTKKERAEFDALVKRSETLAALRWTGPVERDLSAPGYGEPAIQGWEFNSHRSYERVFEAWSSSTSNGTGQHAAPPRVSGSQGSRSLFSSKEKALRALRHELEKRAAEELRLVDAALNEETKKRAAPNETPS